MISFHSLRWKLIGSYLVLVAAVLVAVVALTRYSVATIFATYQENVLVRDASQFARVFGRDYSATHDWHQIAPMFSSSTQFARNDIWILNTQGLPVLQQPPNAPAGERPTLAMLQPALHGQVVTGQINGLLTRPSQVWAAVPLRSNDAIVGVVFVVAAPDSMALSIQDDAGPFRLLQTTADFVTNVEHRLALIGVAVGVLAIALGVWLARSITDPIQELRRAVSRIAAGDLSQRVRVRSSDEVGALAADINSMAERLEADVNELRRQESLRRDLVANVSHDLATPLTGMQGFTEALMDGMVSGEEDRQELYGSIYREVGRLRRLVGDLQDLSSLETGMGHIEPQPLRLDELADEALAVEHLEAAERGVNLIRQMPPDIPMVLADGGRITQVLLNLLDNALRFTPDGGSITVSARASGDTVVVTVADTGAGIPAAELPQIFERFYRVDRSRSRETGGGGLGLAIVKAIVTAHGGQIAATSVLGEGTQMSFTLPRLPAAAAATLPAPPEKAARRRNAARPVGAK
jgi:two-component system, OmpR family, sensor histidine kinase BaeS